MIDLSPKALRFARLVAETQLHDVSNSRVDELRHRESEYAADLRAGNVAKYLSISDDLARFCLNNIRSFLQKPVLSDGNWDGNDIQFLTSISTYLSERLPVKRNFK